MEYRELINKAKEMREFITTKEKCINLKNKISEIEAIEEECGRVILQNNIFNMSEESYQLRIKRRPNLDKRILEPNATYHMSEEDLEKYLKMVHEARTKKGIQAKDWETSSTFKMFEEMQELENKLIKMIIELAPVEIKEKIKQLFKSYKYRPKAIETMLSVE